MACSNGIWLASSNIATENNEVFKGKQVAMRAGLTNQTGFNKLIQICASDSINNRMEVWFLLLLNSLTKIRLPTFNFCFSSLFSLESFWFGVLRMEWKFSNCLFCSCIKNWIKLKDSSCSVADACFVFSWNFAQLKSINWGKSIFTFYHALLKTADSMSESEL